MEKEKSSHRHSRKSMPIFGILLILAGLLFIGINFGFFPDNFSHVIFSWQMLIILIGICRLFRLKYFSASLFLFVGGFFMLPRLANVFPECFHWVAGNFICVYWPVLLIGIGILLLLYWFFKPQNDCSSIHCSSHNHSKNHSKKKKTSDFERNSVFGDGEHIILDPEFNGGELNAVFGGITLDLRRTSLPEGESYLEANAVFGGIRIIVPENWFIEVQIDSAFGGFRDLRIPSPEEAIDKSRKLIINGACVFGGGEIKN